MPQGNLLSALAPNIKITTSHTASKVDSTLREQQTDKQTENKQHKKQIINKLPTSVVHLQRTEIFIPPIEEMKLTPIKTHSLAVTPELAADSSPTMTTLNTLPSRASVAEGKSSPRATLEGKLNLLMKLVERVRGLELASVKNVQFLSKSGVVVEIPGPWSIHLSRTATPVHATKEDNEEEPPDELADEEDDDETHEDEEDKEFLESIAHLDRKKFVVRNEFGHVRIQHLIEAMENSSFGLSHDRLAAQLEIGGHCVLSKKDFDLCIQKQWGQPHPLSGKYHPIAGTVIPETTLLFYAPRSDSELEAVWKIVQASYHWALSGQN